MIKKIGNIVKKLRLWNFKTFNSDKCPNLYKLITLIEGENERFYKIATSHSVAIDLRHELEYLNDRDDVYVQVDLSRQLEKFGLYSGVKFVISSNIKGVTIE